MEWISVEKQLPEKPGIYLVYLSKSQNVITASFRSYGISYDWYNNVDFNGYKDSPFIITDKVTHWMPLPEPPDDN